MNNFGLKVVSLVMSVLLFAFVHYFFVNEDGRTNVLQLLAPVEVKNLPADRLIIWPPTRTVELSLRGSSFAIARVATNPPVVRVEIPEDAKNLFAANIRREDIKLPRDVEILNIRPQTIEFTLDNRIKRSVPVVAPRIGALPEGLILREIKLVPDQIELSGPETELRDIVRVETEPIDMRTVTESTKRKVKLRSRGALSQSNVDEVAIEISIGIEITERTFARLPVELRTSRSERLKVNPPTVDVRLSGPTPAVRLLTPEQILPFVRVENGVELGRSLTLPVQVQVPNPMQVGSVEPGQVQVVQSALDDRADSVSTIKRKDERPKQKILRH